MSEQTSLLPSLDPDALIAQAKAEHNPVASVCLFSGGHDSTVVAHRCREHYESLAFIDTGTAIPGVRSFVEEFAAWLEKPLTVFDSGDAFREMVLGVNEERRGDDWAPMGFPGPAQHGRAYNRLKEWQLEELRRRLKDGHPRSARVLFVTGVRRAESQRRARRKPINRKASMVFVNPLIDWTGSIMREYRTAHDLPESDVAALLHKSGECNCGSFAAPGEREMLEALYPEWFERTIASLEREAEAAGIPACRWGIRPPGDRALARVKPGPLCSDCQLSMEISV